MANFLQKIRNALRLPKTTAHPEADSCPPKTISVQEAARRVVDQYGEALIKLKNL